jgi:hypothetical protein
MSLESIVRPFQDVGVTPTPVAKPGSVGAPPVIVKVGYRGGTKTYSWSMSFNETFRLSKRHKEKAPTSPALQNFMSQAANQG